MEHQSCEIPLLFYKGCFAVTSGVTLVIVLGSSPGFGPNRYHLILELSKLNLSKQVCFGW